MYFKSLKLLEYDNIYVPLYLFSNLSKKAYCMSLKIKN